MIKLKDLLIEGGHLFPDVVGIKQTEIEKTVKAVEATVLKKLGLKGLGSDCFLLGSAGKKPADQLSGDLDIGVSSDQLASANKIALSDTIDWLQTKLKSMGYAYKLIPGFSQISIAYPIIGRETDKCQVDLMLSSNLDWTNFVYYSPDLSKGESKYKAVYRNLLYGAITSEIKTEVIKSTDDGIPLDVKKYVLRFNDGVYSVVKSFAGKSGNVLKKAKLMKNMDVFVTQTPSEFVELLFGPGVGIDEVRTFEQVYDLTFNRSEVLKPYRSAILKKFTQYVKDSGLPMPEIVK